MVDISAAVAIFLGGIILGDLIHPVRRTVVVSLAQAHEALEQDVDDGES